MFNDNFIRHLQAICNSYPKPTLMYRKAAAILKSYNKEMTQKKERGYYKVLLQLMP